jgi:hypothetical protein
MTRAVRAPGYVDLLLEGTNEELAVGDYKTYRPATAAECSALVSIWPRRNAVCSYHADTPAGHRDPEATWCTITQERAP